MNTEERVIQWIEDDDEISLAVEMYLEDIIRERIVDKLSYAEMIEYIGLLRDETPDGLKYWKESYDETILDDWLNEKLDVYVQDF